VEKYGRTGQASDINMAPARLPADTYGKKHTLKIRTLIVLPLQQWLYERA